MANYEYARIKMLAEGLAGVAVPENIAAQILEGGEAIVRATSSTERANWLRGAMERMDSLLDERTRRAVREACACCLGGERLKLSRAIAKNHATLPDRIAAANDVHYVFGHSVTAERDGRLLVLFRPEHKCFCIHEPDQRMSETYCYCCGGHIKHHLQIALGVKLECEVRSSARASEGKEPCSFLYTILD
jgi:hypothetical protein